MKSADTNPRIAAMTAQLRRCEDTAETLSISNSTMQAEIDKRHDEIDRLRALVVELLPLAEAVWTNRLAFGFKGLSQDTEDLIRRAEEATCHE
jgi:hypothetical protein